MRFSARRGWWCRWLAIASILVLALLTGCGGGERNGDSGSDRAMRASPTAVGGAAASMIRFRTSGAVSGTYILRSTLTTSKLRHGHREFTIDVASGSRSIFLAFYGYAGPGSYRLAGHDNGGDVRIDLGSSDSAWDLPMQRGVACTLEVSSQVGTASAGIDRMTGSFACPLLAATTARGSGQQIRVEDGRFDLLIIVES